jgi:hypothetical protein
MRAALLSMRRRIAFATPVSAVAEGSKMNARSLRAPSALTSDATIGVNGEPDESRPIAVSSSPSLNGYVTVPTNECRRSKLLGAHSRTLGSPAVVADENPPVADPPPADDWSCARDSVYETLKIAPARVMPFAATASCLLSDARSEPTAITWPYCGATRDDTIDTAPVAGTIADGLANTGRLRSPASVNRGVASRLRSRNPYWFTPRA